MVLNQLPFVTINILTHNRKNKLDITLHKVLKELNYPRDKYEVIVVDNASSDGTSEMIKEKYPEVKVIRMDKNIGIAGWNEGFKVGKGDYFLALDDDAYVEGDTLVKLIEMAKRSNANVVSLRVINPETNEEFTKSYPTGLLSFWGCSVLMARETLEKIGYYDENIFIWAHELEYTIRLLNAGLTHLYCTDLVAYHMKKTDTTDKYKLKYYHRLNFRSFYYIIGKYFRGKYLFKAFISLTIRVFYFNLKNLIKGNLDLSDIYQNFRDYIAYFRKGLANSVECHKTIQELYINCFVEFQALLRSKNYDSFYKKHSVFYPESGNYTIKLKNSSININAV